MERALAERVTPLYVLSFSKEKNHLGLVGSMKQLGQQLGEDREKLFHYNTHRGTAWHCSGTEWTALLRQARRPQVSPTHICTFSRSTWREGTGELTRPSCLLVVLDNKSKSWSHKDALLIF